MKATLHAIYLLFAVALAPTLFAHLQVFGVKPNIFLIYIVIAGFYVSKTEGIWLGLITGFLFDIIVGVNIGLNGILYMFACFLVTVLCENMIRRSNALLVAITVMIWTAILESIAAIFCGGAGIWQSLKVVGTECIYNGVLSVIIFILLKGIFGRLYGENR